jgi:hypothetical protein
MLASTTLHLVVVTGTWNAQKHGTEGEANPITVGQPPPRNNIQKDVYLLHISIDMLFYSLFD